jgi:glycine cleavage system H protein
MDGFSYINIFETKGIEYLIIIAFLLMVVPFWIIMNRKVRGVKILADTGNSLTLENLRIPHGLFYSKNHTWTYLEKSGKARVGLDDLLLHITGEVKIQKVKVNGERVNRGDVIAEISGAGKTLRVLSPLSGEIFDFNGSINDKPGLLNDDPYGKGWIYKIKPADWVGETGKYPMAEDAVKWTRNELEKFKEFLAFAMHKYSPQTSPLLLQDGGELLNNPFPDMPAEAWNQFQESFLNETW